jgi:hypothetical protein
MVSESERLMFMVCCAVVRTRALNVSAACTESAEAVRSAATRRHLFIYRIGVFIVPGL